MRPFLLLAALLLPATDAVAQSSGEYQQLTVAVVGTEVYGVFSEQRVGNGTLDAPQFSCAFLLRGTLGAGRGIVRTWYPGEPPIKGNIAFNKDGVSLMLQENHGGCMNTSGDMVDQPFTSDLAVRRTGWIGVGLITARRAVLRSTPGASNKLPYVVRSDPVAILERRGAWLHVMYSGEKTATGWVNAGELAIAQ